MTWSATWSAIGPLLLGVAAWLVTSFFAKPLLDFFNLKSSVFEELVFIANINSITEEPPTQAEQTIRRLGAKVQATDLSASFLLRWFLRICQYDLDLAGRNLIGLSNSLGALGRHVHIDRIEKGLKLPRTSSDDFLKDVKE